MSEEEESCCLWGLGIMDWRWWSSSSSMEFGVGELEGGSAREEVAAMLINGSVGKWFCFERLRTVVTSSQELVADASAVAVSATVPPIWRWWWWWNCDSIKFVWNLSVDDDEVWIFIEPPGRRFFGVDELVILDDDALDGRERGSDGWSSTPALL